MSVPEVVHTGELFEILKKKYEYSDDYMETEMQVRPLNFKIGDDVLNVVIGREETVKGAVVKAHAELSRLKGLLTAMQTELTEYYGDKIG